MPKPRNEYDWLRNNVFYTTCNVGGKVCNMIIDGGSCENVVSQEVIDKLKLIAEDNTNTPGLMKVVKIKVSKRCLVSFSISEYFDDVCNDIVPMDVCHILLGQPWQYDRQTIHDGKRNTYTIVKDDHQYTLLPMKQKKATKVTTNDSSSIFVATKENIEKHCELDH